ncbi:ankyrin repeat domain-containing protein [Cupriavidus oxalaticus]|uniref:Ankyrin repeat domain-containing protein n=1 Tax=Cupriavidus oxalaticus TaxID=96344 RepID=A0A4P7LNX4_9BURK|nr:ankyrin repeat domain-containing protein [Cupriavidus oxalaticus]QBY54447.1 ankyrin repeat domain-containing protein [Cupriavidus oxalaticus]
MSTLPLTEAILLEIHQSLGCEPYQTTKKTKFATGQNSLEAHKAMGGEILCTIFDALDMDPQAQGDATRNLMEFGDAYKFLELNTWTFAADQRQILWTLLGHFYVPGLARRMGFWTLAQVLDKGMPGGRFWYLPEPCEVDGKPSLHLPVAQVVDWLLDLLGMPLEELADQRSESTHGGHEGLRRSLYNWRNATPIRPDTILKYFPDDAGLDFKGAFSLDSKHSPAQQFADALGFVKSKELTADRLRLEIPMTQTGRLEPILDGHADEEEQATFVGCLAERYAAPSLHTIRQRLLLARAVQDGYIRLLKFLCPGVDRQCADPQQNKLLQLFAIYKLVYNLTIDAWRHCRDQGEAAENTWFEKHLPEWDKHGLFLSILPSRREAANQALAHMLTRRFCEMEAGAELEDYIGLDAQSALPIIQRNVERVAAFAEEINSELRLVARMKTSSPWRALQGEKRYWVISQVVQNPDLGPLAKQAAIQRLRELAATPAQTVQAILLELDSHLNGERQHRPKDTQAKVQALLDEAEASEGYGLWRAAILQYKAKHLLACNDFEGAGKLFREALEAGLERNYGPLRGEVARDCLAMVVADQKLSANNHEKYYRAMLAGGMMAECEEIPPLEETARWASTYFWDTLYKPYPGVPAEKRRASGVIEKMFKELMPLLISGDQGGLQEWIKANRPLLKSNLPDVDGNSVLMGLIKMHSHFLQRLPPTRQMIPTGLQGEARRFETMLGHWRQFFGQLAKESPKQLNMTDLKGQTPLMLMAEDGDAELVRIMLQAGADPEMQDWQGMTALHSACKSRVDGCVDALLDHPCKLDKLTSEGRSPLHTASWAGNVHAVNRLMELAPGLVWKRDSFGNTPLELAESFIEHPDALEALAEQRARDGKRCASKQELEAIVQLLERVAPMHYRM